MKKLIVTSGLLLLAMMTFAHAEVRDLSSLMSDPAVQAKMQEQGISKEMVEQKIQSQAPKPTVITEQKANENASYSKPLSSIEKKFYARQAKPEAVELRQYGYSFFEGGFFPDEDAPLPTDESYILGPKDEIEIYVWGKVQQKLNVVVDKEGQIFLPKIGKLSVWGKRFSEVKKLITNSFSAEFANFELSINLGRLRSIKVAVMGEVVRPGVYNISSIASFFNVLQKAGGISRVGSLRGVKIVRNNSTYTTIDLYSYLLSGKWDKRIELQENDTIFVPPIGRVAAISGEVLRPGIYELKKEDKLDDLLYFAGQETSFAAPGPIQVQRIGAQNKPVLLDLLFKDFDSLSKDPQNIILADGDMVIIPQITSDLFKYAVVKGNVEMPGKYEIKEGMRLGDLIKKSGGLRSGTYLLRADIERGGVLRPLPELKPNRVSGESVDKRDKNILNVNLEQVLAGKQPDNLLLQEGDEIFIYAEKDIVSDQLVEISGAVKYPGKYKLLKGMRVSDLVFGAGGVAFDANLENAGMYELVKGSAANIKRLNLKEILTKPGSDADILLSGGNHIAVHSKQDVLEKSVCTVKGEVKFAGDYIIYKGETLGQLLKRCGGLNDEAFIEGLVFLRKDVAESGAKAQEKINQFEMQDLIKQSVTAIESNSEQLITYQKELISLMKVGGYSGRMIVELNRDLDAFIKSDQDIELRDGDQITIGKQPETVQVVGSVYNPGAVKFEKGKTAEDYIKLMGGVNKFADIDSMYVLRASGKVFNNKGTAIMDGDIIFIPAKFEAGFNIWTIITSLTTIIFNIAGSVAVFRSL